MSLGSRIKEERKRRKISGVEFAELLGKSASVLSSWETDKVRPSDEQLEDIAGVLNIPVEALHCKGVTQKEVVNFLIDLKLHKKYGFFEKKPQRVMALRYEGRDMDAYLAKKFPQCFELAFCEGIVTLTFRQHLKRSVPFSGDWLLMKEDGSEITGIMNDADFSKQYEFTF